MPAPCSPAPADYLSGGIITFDGNITGSNIYLNGATTVGTGLVTLAGTNTFDSGVLGGIETVPGGCTLKISAATIIG